MKGKMLKMLTFFVSICLILSFYFCTVFAAHDIPKYVRIGLEYRYKNISSASISNRSIGIGSVRNEKFVTDVSLTATEGFTMSVSNKTYVSSNDIYGSYSEALNRAQALYPTYKGSPAYLGEGLWSVYFYDFNSSEEVQACSQNLGNTPIITENTTMELKDGANTVIVFHNATPQIVSEDGTYISLGDRKYRGAIEFGRYTKGSMTAVNVVDLDEYLYSVVPSEMPASYEKEALKAQAVAARTYTLANISAHKSSGYQLCDGVDCQVYKGVDGEFDSAMEAVEETKGILAYYNGEPINAVFFASSGGYTESSENVWLEAVPYLKAVPDTYEWDTNTWSKTITLNDLSSRFIGSNLGEIKDIVISKINDNGRIQEIQIVGTDGIKTLEKDSIRTFFGINSRMFQINGKGSGIPLLTSVHVPVTQYAYNANGAINFGDDYVLGSDQLNTAIVKTPPLPEKNVPPNAVQTNDKRTISAFTVSSTPTPVSTINSEGTFVFTGVGNGHGVGLSQKGAQGLAKQGYDYIDILEHYYTGITVE